MSYLNEKQLGQLLRPINGRRVHKTQGQSHTEAYDIRAHLNRIFGFAGWSGDVIEMALVAENHGVNKSNAPAVSVVYRAGYRLVVKSPDGEALATYTEYAAGDALNFPLSKIGDAHDFAMKTAESQALKRASINLGDQFGLSLYNAGSLAPLVGATLVAPDAGAAKDGVDDDAPVVTPEAPPEGVEPTRPPWDEGQARAAIKFAKGDKDVLRKAWTEAKASGATDTVLDLIADQAMEAVEGTVIAS